jgi:hypothetical protein
MATTSLFGMLGRALHRPGLLASMARAAWRFRARGWWRRPPFLPVPPRDYVEWRLHTAYGDDGREPTAAELHGFLRWANRMSADRGRGGSR